MTLRPSQDTKIVSLLIDPNRKRSFVAPRLKLFSPPRKIPLRIILFVSLKQNKVVLAGDGLTSLVSALYIFNTVLCFEPF